MRASVNYKDLNKLVERLENVNVKKACEYYINDCLAMALDVATSRTMVDTGTLKNGWQIEKVNSYKGVLYNPVSYAMYYEYGHKTSLGNWVVGRFPMTHGKNKVKRHQAKLARRAVERALLD